MAKKPDYWQQSFAKDSCRSLEPPLQMTYAATHLPNGKLTIAGRKHYLRKAIEQSNRKRQEPDGEQ